MKTMPKRPKILVIVGPTASGKSDLAVEIARAQNGEIISADSRQVYRGMNIGTGKITKHEMHGVPHHLLDVASPTARRVFTVADYQKLGTRAIEDILGLGKLPIVVGGTGFYIQALVDGVVLPDVAPNEKLRAKLAAKSPADLIQILRKLDPVRAKKIDAQNPRRLVRAIEIATALGEIPRLKSRDIYSPIFIGIDIPLEELRARIAARLKKRMRQGMVREARELHARGISWKRMESFGLEYRYLARYLQGKIACADMLAELELAIFQYAKRQMMWFKRDKRIKWMKIQRAGHKKLLQETIKKFLR